MMDSIEKITKFIDRARSPYLNIYPDVGNLTSAGIDVRRDFMTGIGHIMAIHLKDTMPGMIRDIPYGEGTVDFISFFRFLKKINFKGLLVAEMWATDDPQASVQYVRTAKEFLLERYKAAQAKATAKKS